MADRILAEYPTEAATVHAIHRLREEGYVDIEAYMPFPSHVIEHALDRPRSRLPIAIFVVGICAAAGAYFLQWFLVAYLYPLVVGDRPPHFPLAFIIITFEMGILFAGLTAFFGTLRLGRLVRLVDGVQGTPGFDSVTRDHYWLEISTRDPSYDPDATRRALAESGALRIETAEGTP